MNDSNDNRKESTSLRGFERRGKIGGDEENSQTNWEDQNTPSVTSSGASSSILTITLLVLLPLLGGGWLLFKDTPHTPDTSPAKSSPSVDSHRNIPVPESTLYDLPPLTVAKNFALTTDAEERLKWTRNPEDVRKRLSQYPLGAREVLAHKITPVREVSTEDLRYNTFLAELENGERRLLCVIGTPDGPRVDWDAYARYGTASWDEILAGKVSQATVRIFPQPSTHYLRNFRDKDKWLAFALASPDLEIPLYGYLDKTSAHSQKINRLLNSGSRRAVVEIKISPEDIQHRQVEITGLRTLGWVEP